MTVTGVPDGTPTQPSNDPPTCVGKYGSVGRDRRGGLGDPVRGRRRVLGHGLDRLQPHELHDVRGVEQRFVRGPDARSSRCITGQPLTFRAKPLAANKFAGVRTLSPPGGFGDVRCSLGATTVPDADDPHEALDEDIFPRPGAWSCVARGVAEGRDENFDTFEFGTPFSAPLTVEVRSDFRRRLGKVAKPRSKRPRFTFKAEWPGLSKGGRATVTVSRVRGCKGKRFKLRKFGTFKATFGAKKAQMRIKRPRADGYYLGRFAFSGTHFIRASVDPNPVYLLVENHRLGFASQFPGCS